MVVSQKGSSVVFLLLVAFLLTSSPASAAYFYDWKSTSARLVSDPPGDADLSGGISYDGRDILSAYQAYDAGYLYFRIDLASTPTGPVPPNYANTYGLYIDSKPDYGAPEANNYVPHTLSGIDFIISSDLTFNNNTA